MIDFIQRVQTFFRLTLVEKLRSKRGKRIWIEFFYEEPTRRMAGKQFGGRRLWLFCQFPFIYGLIDLLAFKQAIAVRLGRWINILYIQGLESMWKLKSFNGLVTVILKYKRSIYENWVLVRAEIVPPFLCLFIIHIQ